MIVAAAIIKGARGLDEKARHGTGIYPACPNNVRFQGPEVV